MPPATSQPKKKQMVPRSRLIVVSQMMISRNKMESGKNLREQISSFLSKSSILDKQLILQLFLKENLTQYLISNQVKTCNIFHLNCRLSIQGILEKISTYLNLLLLMLNTHFYHYLILIKQDLQQKKRKVKLHQDQRISNKVCLN